MVLKGHVTDGVIVLDSDKKLPDGVTVYVTLAPANDDTAVSRRYRGLPYRYDDPFGPAVPDEDWDALR